MAIFFGLLIFCAFTFHQVNGQLPGGRGTCTIRGPGSCFGTHYDAQRKMFCCSGEPYPCSSPAGWACCGKILVNSERYLCCSNDHFPKGLGMACCDKNVMNVRRSVCCDGEVRPKTGSSTYCCNKKSYDSQTQMCCGKDIVLKASAIYNLACAPGNDAAMGLNPPHGGPVSDPGHSNGPPPPSHDFNNGPSPPPQFGPPPSPGFNSGPPPPSFNSGPPPPSFIQPRFPFQQRQNINPGPPHTSNQNWNRPNPQTMRPQSPRSFKFNLQVLQQMLKSLPVLNRNVG